MEKIKEANKALLILGGIVVAILSLLQYCGVIPQKEGPGTPPENSVPRSEGSDEFEFENDVDMLDLMMN